MKTQSICQFNFAVEFDFNEILTNPIMDISARIWDEERYEAFKLCYRSMRVIDDIIDERKAKARSITEFEKKKFTSIVNDWNEAIKKASTFDPFQKQFIKTKFKIPLWPWQKFAKSMIYDLDHNGFKTFQTFLMYSEGAAVAPASVFMHLCGISKDNGVYMPPKFDVERAARPLAIFAYLVHIIRDFQKDQLSNLNYFADDLISKNGLDRMQLRKIAEGSKIIPGFRNLMEVYYNYADYYRREAREMMDNTQSCLEPRYQLSRELIYSLYGQIHESIDVFNGRFTTEELNPSPEEVQDRINMTISSFESNNYCRISK